MALPEGIQKKFQSEIDAYKNIEKDRQKALQSRQQLEAQLTENNLVKEEMDLLEADATIYKLIGPVLVKQDLGEARTNVAKRIDYIKTEIKRQEATMEDLNKKEETQKAELEKIQQVIQQAQVKAAIRQ